MWLPLLLILIGLVCLVYGADKLVGGASSLALGLHISPIVVGLTVVAFGSSAPELAACTLAAFRNEADLAFGNVLGSNIFNVLVILGLSAIVTPLLVHPRLLKVDVPLVLLATTVAYFMSIDGLFSRWEAVVLVLGVIIYTVILIKQSRRAGLIASQLQVENETIEQSVTLNTKLIFRDVFWVTFGIALLIGGAQLLVTGSVQLAKLAGISELLIGLTIISIGTSLPEVAASIVAAVRGHRDIAVGNVVGSNLFNILAVLGASGLVAPSGIPVGADVLSRDFPIVLAISVMCFPLFYTKSQVTRLEGAILVLLYSVFLLNIILFEMGSQHADFVAEVSLWGVTPVAIGFFLLTAILQLLYNRRQKTKSTAPTS